MSLKQVLEGLAQDASLDRVRLVVRKLRETVNYLAEYVYIESGDPAVTLAGKTPNLGALYLRTDIGKLYVYEGSWQVK